MRREMRLANLHANVAGVRTITQKIKGLPSGWNPLLFHECKCGHDRDAVVLCRRSVDDGDHGTNYVVWSVNMDLGGCFLGFYTDCPTAARQNYDERKARLQ